MKKTMFLALTVLGMVLGSIAVVQPVKAQGGPCGDPIVSGNCIVELCGTCLYINCNGSSRIECGGTDT